MKSAKLMVIAVAALLSVVVSGSVLAGGGYGGRGGYYGHGYYGGRGGHFGFSIGVPFGYYPPYYYRPYYPYYPPVVVVPAVPPSTTYIEQGNDQPVPAPESSSAQPSTQPPAQISWHYCAESGAYYPYVKECPGGWQRVSPQPPPSNQPPPN